MQAGDEIVQVAAGPEAMTVAEVDALLYLPGHSRQRLAQALRIPALPDGWKASFQAMLNPPGSPGGTAGNAGLTAVSPPPAWPGFRPLAVTALERESDSVISVLPGRSWRSRRAARPARTVPDPAAARQPGRSAAAAQLLAVRSLRAPVPTGSASSASRTARAASSCTPGCGQATCWRWPRRAAPSSSRPGRHRSC